MRQVGGLIVVADLAGLLCGWNKSGSIVACGDWVRFVNLPSSAQTIVIGYCCIGIRGCGRDICRD